MNIESKINVHQSSLVGLRAELLRKKSEVEAAKANQQNVQYLNRKKEKIDKKSVKEQKKEEKRKRKEEREERDEDPDTMRAHKKSQLMLQAKSRLYDQLSKTHSTINPNFLVDFENKPDVPDFSDEDDKCRDEEDRKSDYYDDSDGEWVEYTDCFGRSRTCLREDLPKMQKEDNRLRNTIIEAPRENTREQVQFVEDREPMKEPTIEIMRRKWEEQMVKLADKEDIHYQDILFDEARNHGVGYYAFSQDEEERAKQQESLAKLRKETEKKQQENQKILEMKERIQQNRLKAARVRQRLRAGLPPEDPEEEKTEGSEVPQTVDDKLEVVLETKETNKEDIENSKNVNAEESNKQEEAKNKLQNIENKVKAFGEMLGKRNKWYVMSQDEWVQKKRKERINEFAPAYENFRQGETLNINESPKDLTDSNDSNVINHVLPCQDESDVVGPMPPSLIEEDLIGPKPPPLMEENLIGSVPPSLNSNFIETVPPPIVSEDFIGPVPPPVVTEDFIGPVPPQITEDFIGPVPPQTTEDFIGPVPPQITTEGFTGLVPPPLITEDFIGPVPPPIITGSFTGPIPPQITTENFIGPVPPPIITSGFTGPVQPQITQNFTGPVPPPIITGGFTGPVQPQITQNFTGPVPPPITGGFTGPVAPQITGFIGPVPPPIITESFIGPAPSFSQSALWTVPPPPPQEDSESSEDSTSDDNINIEEQIAAGLKFLRQQFESKHKR